MMQKNKLIVIRDFIVKHCKYFFPVIVVAVVAVTAAFAFKFNHEKNGNASNKQQGDTVSGDSAFSESSAPWWLAEKNSEAGGSSAAEGSEDKLGNAEVAVSNLWDAGIKIEDISAEYLRMDEIPYFEMQPNEDSAIYALVETYYNAQADGDIETLRSICDTISENDLAYYQALSEYLDRYIDIRVSTKRGLVDGSVVAYVYYRVCFVNHEEEFPGSYMLYICTNEDGGLYIKNNFTEAEEAYIETISSQADVSEFKNRVDVEYNDFIRENPTMLVYLEEVINQASINHGVALAEMNQSDGQQNPGEDGQDGNDTPSSPIPETPVTPEYATATATVNVRSSDSEQAEKLGRVSSGTRVKVQEVLVNGWTKVVYEGNDGYIKSQYLQFAETAAGQNVIGTVTANTNINVRASASQTAQKLGVIKGGDSLELLAVEGDWCKVIFDGQIAYVKAEFVQQN